jgi:hypothetical protein
VQPIVVVNTPSLQQTGTGGRFDPPVLTPSTSQVQGSPTDFSPETEVPAVLRRLNRTHGALEALGGFSAAASSGFGGGVASAGSRVEALQSGGKSYEEIPAYLRKQAD